MPAQPSQIDLLKITKDFKVDIKSHDLPQEIDSRLRKEEADAAQRRTKDLVMFFAATAGVAGIAILCGYVAIAPGSSADDKKWATAILASIVSAALGVIVGKNSKE